MSRRTYTYNGFEATLASPITDTSTTIVLSSATGLRAPGYLVINPDSTTGREFIKFDSISAPSLETVSRGLDGSIAGAQAHDSGVTVRGVVTHQLIDDVFLDLVELETQLGAHDGAITTDAHPEATATSRGFMPAAMYNKLDNIEAGAEVNQTDLEIRSQLLNVDGTGSGIDADLLDGVQGSGYAAAVHGHSGYASDSHTHEITDATEFVTYGQNMATPNLGNALGVLVQIGFTMPAGWNSASIMAWGGYSYSLSGTPSTFQTKVRLDVGGGTGVTHQSPDDAADSINERGAMMASSSGILSSSGDIKLQGEYDYTGGLPTVPCTAYIAYIAIRKS